MKVNILSEIKDYKDKPLKASDGVKAENLTWRTIVFNALNTFTKDEQPTGEIKAKCYRITKKIYDSKTPDLTVDERAVVLERIDKIYSSPLICGKSKEFFDEKEKNGN